jgi:hypothetical protein
MHRNNFTSFGLELFTNYGFLESYILLSSGEVTHTENKATGEIILKSQPDPSSFTFVKHPNSSRQNYHYALLVTRTRRKLLRVPHYLYRIWT